MEQPLCSTDSEQLESSSNNQHADRMHTSMQCDDSGSKPDPSDGRHQQTDFSDYIPQGNLGCSSIAHEPGSQSEAGGPDETGPGPRGDGPVIDKMLPGPVSMDAILQEISKGVEVECIQWTRVFRDSEQFEMLSSSHMDKLLADAKALEQNLILQKERLMSHLKMLSMTLKLP